MKRVIFTVTLLSTIIFGLFSFTFQDDPWEPYQLLDPAQLAKVLKDPKAKKPEILNVGPMEKIKLAKDMGVCSTEEGIQTFKAHVDKLPIEREIVIYCGCCKLQNCPNIKKTMLYLNARGYTNAKLLNIPTSLDDDWVKKGYPMY